MTDERKSRKITYEERVERAKIVRKIVFICVSIFSLLVIIGIVSLYLYINSALGAIDETSEEIVEVHIPIGSTSSDIGRILEDAGLIKNANIFRYYVRYKNETGFQAGDYQLSKNMSIQEIISALKEGKILLEPVIVFTIPEGLWLEDIVEIIAENTKYEAEEIFTVIKNPDFIGDLIDRYQILTDEILKPGIRYPLEGYLFPARYDFYDENISIEMIIEEMVKRAEQEFMPIIQEANQEKYSVHELVTLASIIEREAQKSEDRYKISGVLYNRLEKNMKLEVDPSVAYAHGKHLYITTYDDLNIDSPYNTYRYEGIPVGPISNPGIDSLKAAIQPEETEYLFFYARYNGEVIYTKTLQEHTRVVEQYHHEWEEAGQ